MDHEIPAEDGETGERALVTGVHGAVGILGDIPRHQLLLGPQLQGARGGGAPAVGGLQQGGALGGSEIDRSRTRLGLVVDPLRPPLVLLLLSAPGIRSADRKRRGQHGDGGDRRACRETSGYPGGSGTAGSADT